MTTIIELLHYVSKGGQLQVTNSYKTPSELCIVYHSN